MNANCVQVSIASICAGRGVRVIIFRFNINLSIAIIMCCKIFSCRCFRSRTISLIVLWYSLVSYMIGLTTALIMRPWNQQIDSIDLQNIFRILHCCFVAGSVVLGIIPSVFGLLGIFKDKPAYLKFYTNGVLVTFVCLSIVGLFLLKLTIRHEKAIYPMFITFHASMYLHTWPVSLYMSIFYPLEVKSNIVLWSILIFSLEFGLRSRCTSAVQNYKLELTAAKQDGFVIYYDAENQTAQLVVPNNENSRCSQQQEVITEESAVRRN